MNSFGRLYRFTSFGESHGPVIGGVIDGCPANIPIDIDFIQRQLDRRRPGQSDIVSARQENDKVKFLSGIFSGKSTGAPIAFIIENKDQRSEHYEHTKDLFRPSHGDYAYFMKYGENIDFRGSGRYSARETSARVVAGAVAQLVLQRFGISIKAYVSQVGDVKVSRPYTELDLDNVDDNPLRCPDGQVAQKMHELIQQIKNQGDTIGGTVTCIISNVPPGLGEPIYDKFSARLAYAIMSINAARGFEFGKGFAAARMRGSEHNDLFYLTDDGQVRTKTNFSGGIQAGITNGMDVYFNVAFKPVSTIFREQETLNRNLQTVKYTPEGRHDPCVVPRAVPIVEAMAAVTTLDFLLINRAYEL